MNTELSNVEFDFLGDLCGDDHDLWEIFQFVRLHEPELSERAVAMRGRDILISWLERGWIQITDSDAALMSTARLIGLLEERADSAADYFDYAPCIRITDTGRVLYFQQSDHVA